MNVSLFQMLTRTPGRPDRQPRAGRRTGCRAGTGAVRWSSAIVALMVSAHALATFAPINPTPPADAPLPQDTLIVADPGDIFQFDALHNQTPAGPSIEFAIYDITEHPLTTPPTFQPLSPGSGGDFGLLFYNYISGGTGSMLAMIVVRLDATFAGEATFDHTTIYRQFPSFPPYEYWNTEFATVTIVVNSPPEVAAPVDDITVQEDAGPFEIDLAAVFDDPDLSLGGAFPDELEIAVETLPTPGSDPSVLEIERIGNILRITPRPDEHGFAEFRLTASDNRAELPADFSFIDPATTTVTDTFRFTVEPVPDQPEVVAPPDPIEVDEDASDFVVNLSNAFDDADGDALTLSLTDAGDADLVDVLFDPATGVLTVMFVENANGSTSLEVTADDGTTAPVPVPIAVEITAVNDGPVNVAVPDPLIVDEDDPGANYDLTPFFTDVDLGDATPDELTFEAVSSNPAIVDADVSGDTLQLRFPPDQNGGATVTVTATDLGGDSAGFDLFVTVDAVNDAPESTSMPNVVVDEDTTIAGIVLADYFSDVDIATNADSLTYEILVEDEQREGAADDELVEATESAGVLTLALGAERYGSATITVRATDRGIPPSPPAEPEPLSTEQTFSLVVDFVDDPIQAIDDTYTFNEDEGPFVLDILDNDQLGDPEFDVEFDIILAAGIDGEFDGQLARVSESEPTAQRDIFGNDIIAPNGRIDIDNPDRRVIYTPKENFFGEDYFFYRITDVTGDESIARVTINIEPVNDPPQVPPGLESREFTIYENTTLSIVAPGLLTDAYDPDPDDTFAAVLTSFPINSAPSGGFTFDPSGAFSYTPLADFIGDDTFTFRVEDSQLEQSTATDYIVTIRVEEAPPPPPLPPPGLAQAEFDLAETPLEEAIGAEANVLVIMDDSGSMDWSLSTPDASSGCMTLSTNGYIVAPSQPSSEDYCYWLPLATNVYSGDALPSQQALDDDPEMTGNRHGVWRARNHLFNKIYYNPGIQYARWKGINPLNNQEFEDADPEAAPMDPTRSGNTLDLTQRYSFNSFSVPSMSGPGAEPFCQQIRRRRGGFYTYCTSPDGKTVTSTDYYIPRYYTTTAADIPEHDDPHTLVEILPEGEPFAGGEAREDCASGTDIDPSLTDALDNDADPLTCSYQAELRNFANWFTYYRSREYVAKGALGLTVADSNNLRVGFAVINDINDAQPIRSLNTSFRTGNKKALLDEIYDYNSNGGTPLRRALDGAGRHYACYDQDIFGSGSSSQPGDANCPVLPAPEGQCQSNFALLFTDGYWNGYDPSTNVGNADGDDSSDFDGGIFADEESETLADIAMYWYERDLWADNVLADSVPTSQRDRDSAPATAFADPDAERMHQHMKTYTISFGLTGAIDPDDPDQFPPNLADIPDGFLDTFSWGDPFSSFPAKIDDMFHAATNGRGEYLSASNPVLLTQAFASAFSDFETGSTSVSAVAFNSTSLQEGTLLYRGFFDMKNNSGELIAVELDAQTGQLADEISWSAAEQLDLLVAPYESADGHLARNIITYDRVNRQGIPFQFDSLNDDQKSLIDDDGTLDDDDAIVPYLRGQRIRERPVGGLRERQLEKGLLGDIVHSNVIFVGAPRGFGRDGAPYPTGSTELYSKFQIAKKDRTPLVYVGANDGMLHGFHAQTGEEAFGYIPNLLLDINGEKSLDGQQVYPHANPLDQLSTPLYTHKYFVDISPAAEDVFMRPGASGARQWMTVLMGGHGAGGKGYFLLDIDDPESTFVDETSAAASIIWEFTEADDTPPTETDLAGAVDAVGDPLKDLGFTFSEPTIAMSNVADSSGTYKEWVGIFGNGYNSTSGVAKLFVLFLDHGRDGWDTAGEIDFVKISTGAGVPASGEPNEGLPNGLGTPTAVDFDRDGTVDYVYAGDLLGNLYRFDVSDANTNNWSVTRIFRAVYNDGTEVTQQPITRKPSVIRHPDEGLLIIVGTGSYITEEDGVSEEIQSIYGIWDRLEDNPIALVGDPEAFKSSKLVEQTITNIVVDIDGELETLRVFSDNEVDYQAGTTQGWYIDFDMVRAATTQDGEINTDTRGAAPPDPQFPGERAVRRFLFRNGNFITTTVIPRSQDSCLVAPTGAVLVFDAISGGNPSSPFLDLNNDGYVNDGDLVDTDGDGQGDRAASSMYGLGDVGGQLTDPSILRGPGDTDLLFISGSGAEGDDNDLQDLTTDRDIEGQTGAKTGRLSWRELEFNPQ